MPTLLKSFLPTFVKPSNSWQLQLLNNWPTIVGNLATKVTLEKIEKDTLVIGVYDACWMQELYLLSPLLIDTINQNLDQPRIKHLRFKRAVVKKKNSHSTTKEGFSALPQRLLTARERAALEKIKDPQLRNALQQFLMRCHKEK